MPNKRPYSMKPRFLDQPLWWWSGKSMMNRSEFPLFASKTNVDRLRDRPGRIFRRARGVRPRPIRSARETYNRGRRGYTLSDTWSLDSYLTSWLPEAIEDLKNGTHGHPGGICDHRHDGTDDDTPCDGMERWGSVLDQIRDGLLAARALGDLSYYEVGDPWDEVRQREEELTEEFNEAWTLMGEWFFALWD